MHCYSEMEPERASFFDVRYVKETMYGFPFIAVSTTCLTHDLLIR